MTYGYAQMVNGKRDLEQSAQLLKQQTEYASGNDTFTTAEPSELREGGFRGRSMKAAITEGKALEAAQMRGRCPRCHKPCMGIYRRWVPSGKGKRYYWYAAHYAGGKRVRWCYIGRRRPPP